MSNHTTYIIRRLVNGFYRVDQRGSGLTAMYNADGTFRHGVRFAATLNELCQEEQS